jgi:hypothetical protein
MSGCLVDDGGTTVRVRDIELCLWDVFEAKPQAAANRIYLLKNRAALTALGAVLDDIAPRRMIELGIAEGASIIYWAERYGLDRLAAFDLEADAPALVGYLARHGMIASVRPYFGVSQDDGPALRRAVAADFGADLVDVVIDDASHLYEPTRASFEILFPFVRPGGIYVLEDWAWPPLAPLMSELAKLLWGPPGVLDRIEIQKNFAVLWRGQAPLPADGSFRPLSSTAKP